MKKRIVVGIVLILLLSSTAGAFAASSPLPWMVSYNKPGQLNVYGSVGFYGLGIDINAGPEIILGQFDIAGIPLEWGVMARGMIGFSAFLGYSWLDWAVAPAATLHWGIDLGAPWQFDWYIGLGLGISGSTGTYYSYTGVGFGFASFDGVAWHFSKNLALVVEYGYTQYLSTAGVGVKLAL
jgi:opacity protein-like surface antigen